MEKNYYNKYIKYKKKYLEKKRSNDRNIVNKKIIKLNNYIKNKIKNKNYNLNNKLREYKSSNFVKKDNCVVSLIFFNESYIPALLTLGFSYREYNKNNHNLICMVQDKKQIINGKEYSGVSKKAINDLLKVYDIVYGIDVISLDLKLSDNILKLYPNNNIYATKGQIFNLTNYKKLIYVDASSLIIKNIDYIFKSNYYGGFQFHQKDPGFRGGFIIFNPSLFYKLKFNYILKIHENLFKNIIFKRGVDEIVFHYTLFGNKKKYKYLEKEKWCKDYIEMWDVCNFIFYEINKPFREDKREYKNEKNYYTWDKITKKLLLNLPELAIYYDHIKNIRDIDF
tara:strand:- start:599 stop:1612 length:1014 start_codon:yes stop_codon:yes gene_type:complete